MATAKEIAREIGFDRREAKRAFVRSTGHGRFRCPSGHTWSSHSAVVSVNSRQLFTLRWAQSCRCCRDEEWALPQFSADEWRRLVQSALERSKLSKKAPQERVRKMKKLNGPHDTKRCAFCRKFGEQPGGH